MSLKRFFNGVLAIMPIKEYMIHQNIFWKRYLERPQTSYSTTLAISIYPSIKYHIWSKSELNLANYMSFVIFIEFVSDLDQPGTCSFIRLEMTAE